MTTNQQGAILFFGLAILAAIGREWFGVVFCSVIAVVSLFEK